MELLILDQKLELKQVLSAWEHFSFTQRLNARGEFTLAMNANLPQAEALSVGRLLYLSPAMCGYITRKEVISQTDQANELIKVSGIALKDIIASRITTPPAGKEAFEYINQPCDTIVMDLLDKLLVNPADERKRIPIFSLGRVQGFGKKQDYSTRLKPLDTQVYELLTADQLGLQCLVNLNVRLATISVYKGVNRTIEQSDVSPVVFSLNMGTLEKAVNTEDITAYKTVGIIGGSGEGLERTIKEIPENNSFSGFNRWETFIDLSDAKTEGELLSRGASALAEYGKIYSIDGQAKEADKFAFTLGDTITVQDNQNNYQNVQVTGITRVFDASHMEKRSLVFGKAPISIAQAMNRRLTGLNNILQNKGEKHGKERTF